MREMSKVVKKKGYLVFESKQTSTNSVRTVLIFSFDSSSTPSPFVWFCLRPSHYVVLAVQELSM